VGRAKESGQTTQTQAGEDGQFSQMENAIDLIKEDNHRIAIFLREPLPPTGGAFSLK
jgi:hypothetical protein